MGHPRWLLDLIADDVRRTYPEPDFRYVYEKALGLTDWRNQPDIQVLSGGSTIVCVVEIGYTRPEKLKLYHEREIKDVRWYDKKGRLQPLYVGNPGEPLKRPVAYAFDPDDMWYGAPCGRSNCQILEDRLMKYVGELEDSNNIWTLRKMVRDPVIAEHEAYYPHELRALLESEEKYDWALEMASDRRSFLDWTIVLTDGRYGLAVRYCDMCDQATLDYEVEPLALGDVDLTYGPYGRYDGMESFTRFYAWWSKQPDKFEMHVSKLGAFIAENFGVTVDFENLQPMSDWGVGDDARRHVAA